MAITYLDNVDLSKNQFLNAVLQHIAGNHGSPVEGLLWYDSSAKAVKFHDGTDVRTFGVSGVGADAPTLQGQNGAYYLARGNHTGTQVAATISDFNTAVDARLTGYATDAEVTTIVNNILDGAPGALDTLNELAAAIGDDANFAATINTALGARVRRFSADLGNASATSFAIAHNFNSRDVLVQLRENASPWAQKIPTVEHTDLNTVTLRFGSAVPTLNQYRVTVHY